MNKPFETNFIHQTVGKAPFADMPAQRFFAQWCRINDSIVPEFISREEWEKRGVQGILEKNDQGKQTLFLPTDIHLWEMMDVIKTVDHDTFARNPEKRAERANQIQKLGVVFEKAGLYLSEYLPYLDGDKGKQIAQDIASEFYQYGISLQHKKQEAIAISQKLPLTEEEKTKIDEWFLDRDAYKKKIARLGGNPTKEQVEYTRKKILQVYFEALAREGYKAEGGTPWETKVGPMQHVQDKTRRQITKALETPEREMKTAIFRRGVEKLVTEMKTPNWRKAIQTFLQEGCSLDLATEKVKLSNVLELPRLKKELEEIRQTEDVTQISAKELIIAKIIHKAVSSFPYKAQKGSEATPNYPSEMVKTQFINCVGASTLGGALLDEVSIKYLHVSLPGHSATVLITSDGKVYWQDFTPGSSGGANYVELSSSMFEGNIDLSNLASIQDSGLTIEFKNWKIDNKKVRATLFHPENGLQGHILNNAGGALQELGRNEEAVEAYRQAISVNPQDAAPYNGLGNALRELGRNEEAVEAYKQFIVLWEGDKYVLNEAKDKVGELQQKQDVLDEEQRGN